jgi:MFS family permease
VALFFRLIGGRIFYGWWILVLGSILTAVGMGILYQGFSVFFLPLKRDLALSSAAVSLLYAAARLEGGAEGPLIGYLIGRFGPRAVILFGASLAGVGFILLSTVQSFLGFFLIYIFVVALGNNAGFYHPVSAAVNAWFIRRRGVGFAVISAASNIGGMIIAPILSYLILSYGWRTGAVISGIAILAVCLPAALPIYRSPEVLGLCPDGQPGPEKAGGAPGEPQPAASEANFTVREALRTIQFWILTMAITLRVMVTTALVIHLIPVIVWKGRDEVTGAYMVSLYSFGTILMALALGWWGDRWSKPLLSGVGLLPAVVGMVGLIFSSSNFSLYSFPIGLAVAMGTIPINWAQIGDYFGRQSYAALRGVMGVSYGLAAFISPIFAGWIFDRTGSYAIVFLSFSVILLAAVFLFALLHLRFPLPFVLRDSAGR